MAKYRITGPDGASYDVSAPDDASQEQVLAYAQKTFKMAATPAKKEGFGERVSREIDAVPRQLGLTARSAIEGVGDTLDFFATPFRAAINTVMPDSMQSKAGGASWLADKIGLPSPQNDTERIVASGAKMGFGSVVPVGLAGQARNAVQARQMVAPTALQAEQAASRTPSLANEVFKSMAANPGSQALSATAGGLAGQYTAETGGDDVAQFGTSLAASIAAPMALNKVQQAVNAGKRLAQSYSPAKAQELTARVDVTIDSALQPGGLTLGELPANVRNSIRADVQKALRAEGEVSPDAIRRLADYRLTGATPTVGTVTLDPATVTQQKNLAKLGINSKDRAAQQLGSLENANNGRLIENLNDLGAANAPGAYNAGENLVGRLNGYAAAQQAEIGSLYNAAKDSTGRAAALDPQAFATQANRLLDHNLRGAFVPDNIRTMMNDFAAGRVPLNIHTAEQFKTIIGNAQRGSTDGNVRAALGHIRESLDNTPLMQESSLSPAAVNGGNQIKTVGGLSGELRQNIGQDTLDAFNRARAANRSFMQQVESTPALAAAMDGAHPDAFFQRHVVNAPVNDFAATLGVVGEQGRATMKAEVVNFLKQKALNGAADEVGNFSQSSYNKALNAIGDRKLAMLFEPEELQRLRAVGRVASYEQFQPRGSAVNNSNTAGALGGLLERVATSPLLAKIPFGSQIATPAQNISIGIRSNAALDVPRGLLVPQMPATNAPPAGLLMSPAAFMQQDEKKKGLLSP
jgi:hypothetical protein